MKKLFLIFGILLLGFTLASCDKDDPTFDKLNQVENPALVDDLIEEIKGVFEN